VIQKKNEILADKFAVFCPTQLREEEGGAELARCRKRVRILYFDSFPTAGLVHAIKCVSDY